MKLDTIFFDLDATLYPESNGLWTAIRDRIDRYMLVEVGIPQVEIPHLRENFYRNYGTTLKGLQAHYDISAKKYLTSSTICPWMTTWLPIRPYETCC